MRHRLALALGWSVAELGVRMSHTEYMDWCDYYRTEPWGSHYDDLRSGQVAAVIANVNRDPRRTRNPFLPLDFAPWNAAAIRDREEADRPVVIRDPDAASAAIINLFARATTTP
jgi:hypothetical protein